MVCDRDNTLHLVFRLWRNDTRTSPQAGTPIWLTCASAPKRSLVRAEFLVVAPFSEYSVFYHRLTIDRKSTLFLSHDYWSTFWFYRTDHRGGRRSVLMSPDRGDTWQLAPSKQFVP